MQYSWIKFQETHVNMWIHIVPSNFNYCHIHVKTKKSFFLLSLSTNFISDWRNTNHNNDTLRHTEIKIASKRVIKSYKSKKNRLTRKKTKVKYWSLPSIVCSGAHILNTYLCFFWRSVVSDTYYLMFLLCLRHVYPMLPVSLNCQFLIAPSIFSNVYYVKTTLKTEYWATRTPTYEFL